MEMGGACLYYIHCGVNTVGLVAVVGVCPCGWVVDITVYNVL